MRRTCVWQLLVAGGLLLQSGGPLTAAAEPLHSAASVVGEVERHLETIQAYRCRLHSVSVLGAKQERRVLDYVFQRPNLIRMRVLQGPDRGSVAVYRDGRVRGHRGGLLSWIMLTYPPAHPEVTTIRGGRLDQSDALYLADVLRAALQAGALSLDGLQTRQGRTCYQLSALGHVEALDREAGTGRFWIDREQPFMSAFELYDEAGRLIYRQAHEQLELNPVLPEETFRL